MLVVEDDPNVRQLCATVLLILLDLAMPFMDGPEVLRRFRARVAHHRTPVLIVSATDRGAVPAGAQGVLEKPFAIDALAARVRGLLPDHATRAAKEHRRLRESTTDDIGRSELNSSRSGIRTFGATVSPMLERACADAAIGARPTDMGGRLPQGILDVPLCRCKALAQVGARCTATARLAAREPTLRDATHEDRQRASSTGRYGNQAELSRDLGC